MGSCCAAQGTEQEKQINHQINSHMKSEIRANSTTHKILLLGPGDAGKTTILKQMRKINSGVIPPDTIESYSSYIRSKIILYMKILSKQSLKLNIDVSSSEAETSREFMINLSSPCDITLEIVNHMKLLWNDNGIQKTLQQREKFQIPDNVSYFFNERIDDIVSNNYKPTFDDYLRIRMRTTGFNEESFKTQFGSDGQAIINNTNKRSEYKDLDIEIEKENKKSSKNGIEHTFTFMDVGGQRAERKKWINMLKDNINAVVYIIAISEYDLMCFEDSNTLRLTEALHLFETVLEKGFMRNKTVTLFFNKYDLFIEKLKDESKSTIKDHFPDFPDNKDPRDPMDVCEFVYELFLEIYQRIEKNSQQSPHYHKTSALDTDQIQNVMSDIQSDLIRMQLKLAGF